MNLIDRYLPRTTFESYEDFKENYDVLVPDDFNFAYDIVDEWARIDPGKLALAWCDDHTPRKDYTFTDLKRLSNQTANLFKRIGIGKGDFVLLMLKQRVEVWMCMLALHKLGAVVIPATYQLTPKDIDYRCNAAGIKLICAVDEPEIVKHIREALPTCTTVENVALVGDEVKDGYLDFRREVLKESDVFERPVGDAATKVSDPMLLYFSSGTTGMPKMVLHDFSYPLGHIVTAKYWHQVEDGGLHLTASDSGWAKFGWGKIYGQWICGAVVAAYDNDKFVPEKMLKVISDFKLTTFCAPPTIYRFLIKDEAFANADFSSIKHCTVAGEPLNPEVYRVFKKATGLGLCEGFGQSESSVLIGNYQWFEEKPGSMGKPSPLYDIDIVDEEGNSCEDGVVGSIVVKNTDKKWPAGLFREYYKDPAANARSWHDGTYNTGDTAWRDSDGYFWFVGRNDDVIKCSGYRIGPFEVENALHTHPSVLECAVTAAPDPIRGQVVKATIVLTKGYTASDALKKELQDHVKRVTAPYKYPRIVEFVEELPKTTSGKIRRVEIRKQSYEK